MAYMNQEKKAKIQPKVTAILKKYRLKGNLGVRNFSTLRLNIKSGSIPFIKNDAETRYCHVNEFYVKDHWDGIARDCLLELVEAMNDGNFNNSDLMTDYHHVGWYIDINIGQWDKPYVYND
jgi:hypothetical protein